MSETIQQDPIDLRKEILVPFFEYIKGAESFYVVGGASMGKTRLLDFIMREDVRYRYLGKEADQVWLIRVDMNRLAIRNEAWAFYELLLSSIVLELVNHQVSEDLRNELMEMNTKVIEGRELLLTLRVFEMAVNQLCQGETKAKLCFLLDEFDETYRTLSPYTLSQLRAVRDANKYCVLYGIFLRDLPERLRPALDNEDFYELISRNMLGIGPYTKMDTLKIIQKVEGRRNYPLTPPQREQIYEASGGHIGLAQTLLGILIEDLQASQKFAMPDWLDWFGKQQDCIEECRKIWKGLSSDEQKGLSTFVKEGYNSIPADTAKLLSAKGLLNTRNTPFLFSPIFELYVRNLG
jgi:hypothetical protein